MYVYQPWVNHKAILFTDYSRSSDGMGSSKTPASKLSIASLNMSDRVSWVAEPICGSNVTFDMFANGWSGCIGSGIITSSPAPLIFPDCNENFLIWLTDKQMRHCNNMIYFPSKTNKFQKLTLRAVIRSSWFTIPPLAMLIKIEVFFILANADSLNIPRVSSVRLHATTTISLRESYFKIWFIFDQI